jgi:alpha-beta hydrolase superfamily lysophospholipase
MSNIQPRLAATVFCFFSFLASAQPQIELPKPSGPYAVGTLTYDWQDRSRVEKATGQGNRQLVVQVWYPAVSGAAAERATYVPRLQAYKSVWDKDRMEQSDKVVVHAIKSAEVRKGQYPVVIISHGWQSTRSMLTSFIEDLASRGFIVVGIDHPYMGRIALKDGTVTEPREDQFKNAAEIYDYYTQDALFVLKTLAKLGPEDSILRGHLNLQKTASIGHSSGFIAAGGACISDPRVKACVNLDAPGTPLERLSQIKKPLLWMRLQRAEPLPSAFLKAKALPVWEVTLHDANHGSVTDWDYVFAKDSDERDRAAMRLKQIEDYVAQFLKDYLQDSRSMPSPAPGVDVTVH